MALYPDSVSHALLTTLSSDSTLVDSGVTVELHQELNSSPNATPWVGVYLAGVDFKAARIQGPEPWLATYEFQVICQDLDHRDVGAGYDAAMRLLTPVWQAVNSNRELGGQVHILAETGLEPMQPQPEEREWLTGLILTLRYQVFA